MYHFLACSKVEQKRRVDALEKLIELSEMFWREQKSQRYLTPEFHCSSLRAFTKHLATALFSPKSISK